MRIRLPRRTALVAGIVLLAVSGCGGSGGVVSSTDASEEQATVSGSVTIKGRPATGGEIEFNGSNKVRKAGSVTAKIGGDGTYTIKAFLGTNQVAVKAPGTGYNQTEFVVKPGDNKLDVKVE